MERAHFWNVLAGSELRFGSRLGNRLSQAYLGASRFAACRAINMVPFPTPVMCLAALSLGLLADTAVAGCWAPLSSQDLELLRTVFALAAGYQQPELLLLPRLLQMAWGQWNYGAWAELLWTEVSEAPSPALPALCPSCLSQSFPRLHTALWKHPRVGALLHACSPACK